MTLPNKWSTLPGPADYLASIRSALLDGNSVWAYFPSAPQNLSVRVRPMVRGLGWHRVSSLSDLNSVRLGNGDVYWCEIESDSIELRKTFEEAVKLARLDGAFPRICVLTRSNQAKSVAALKNMEGVRVGVWSDFVTPTDSRALIERIGRKEGWSSGYVDMMGAVVSQIVRNDLSLAYHYATRPLRDILTDTSSYSDDIWSGQVQVLFPRINVFRQRMVRKYAATWDVPWEVEIGNRVREIADINDLEISHLLSQSRCLSGIDRQDQGDLKRAKYVRDRLAHLEFLGWEDLSSDFGCRIFDIKAPKVPINES